MVMLFNTDELNLQYVRFWNVEDVQIWLKLNEYENYSNGFRRNKINGRALLMLDDTDLKEIVDSIGDRKNISHKIRQLQIRFNHNHDEFIDINNNNNNNDSIVCECCLSNVQSFDASKSFEISSETSKNGEKRKTLISALYCFLATLWTAFIVTVSHDRVPNMTKYPPLPDIILGNEL